MEPTERTAITAISEAELEDRLAAIEGVAELRRAAAGLKAYLVGGVVRDLLLGEERADLDVVVEGPVDEIAARLGGAETSHDRFGTATVRLEGGRAVDLATARAETYDHPGALPRVEPADLAADLARRDFTVNAMAIPLAEPRIVDPHSGRSDLEAGLLRVLHERSFRDDPTRAIRAARYVARLGLQPEPATHAALVETDLDLVSADRVESELRKLAREPRAVEALALLAAWGIADVANPSLAAFASKIAEVEPWRSLVDRAEAVLVAGGAGAGAWRAPAGALARARELVALEPQTPSGAVAAAGGASPLALMLARAIGAGWIDDYMSRWRHVRLEITGDELIAAGVEQGPAVGRGLKAALAAKLDAEPEGELGGPQRELEVALAAVREGAR